MTTDLIDASSPHLETVKAMGKANTATLGFLPEGAFDEYAHRRQIIVALGDDGACVGYVLFRVSRRRIHLVHLCVETSARGTGVGRAMVDRLKGLTKEAYLGISLKCRRDYSVNKVWPRFGFIVRGEVAGRGKDRMPLTCWSLDYGHPTLFTEPTIERLSSKLCVVLDANIFFDLEDEDRDGHVESSSLLADWLPENLELCLTDEIFNEIDRGTSPSRRQQAWTSAQRFTIAPCDDAAFETTQRSMRKFFGAKMSPRDQSDLRQLARTVASDIQFFVTRDEGLLGRADEVYEATGLSVIRPSDLILRFDELRRESEYQPVRLAGTLSKIRLVQRSDQKAIIETFQLSSLGETKEAFKRKLHRIVSDPQTYQCQLAESSDGLPMVVFAFSRKRNDTLEIPLLRVRRGPLAETIVRYLIFYANWLAAGEGRAFTRITEELLDKNVVSTIATDNFSNPKSEWVKVNVRMASTAVQIGEFLRRLDYQNEQEREFFLRIAEVLQRGSLLSESQTMSDLEYLLWPVKILDAQIPNFIIPIRPGWAKDLFDENLANQTLFGAKIELALNRESAYYRAKNPSAGLTAPARILWYVSKRGKGYSGVGSLRACSQLSDVVVGKPKDLFRQFRRLGVYEWSNVFGLADRNLNHELMALRFSDTELFPKSISLVKLQEVLSKHGRSSQFMSPVRISAEVFSELYELGTGTGEETE